MKHRERVEKAFNELRTLLDTQVPDHFELVVVFGSYAKGYPRDSSDLDLYLVSTDLPADRIQTENPSEVGFPWSNDLPSADITAMTPEEFIHRYYSDEHEFIDRVLEEGMYIRGAPRDIKERVDYDPISDEWK